MIYGTFLTLLGTAVWRFRLVDILAGYDEKKVSDKAGLAKWTGRNLVLMGLLILLNVILSISGFEPVEKPFLLDILVIFTLAVLTAAGARKYERRLGLTHLRCEIKHMRPYHDYCDYTVKCFPLLFFSSTA
nr:DUF3784 domain-containing protein [Methanosarcina sp. KYL-1]